MLARDMAIGKSGEKGRIDGERRERRIGASRARLREGRQGQGRKYRRSHWRIARRCGRGRRRRASLRGESFAPAHGRRAAAHLQAPPAAHGRWRERRRRRRLCRGACRTRPVSRRRSALCAVVAACASGAQSSTMPRLVFCPTRAHVASIAPAMRAPTVDRVRADEGRGGLGAGEEIRRRHAMAVGENMDIAGLGRLQLRLAGGDEGGRDLLRVGCEIRHVSREVARASSAQARRRRLCRRSRRASPAAVRSSPPCC